uniref:Uncharacterized protein n=1 Tax=Leptobrachium leishanense TaxID=445787 RepID=A0A8C5QJ40_9ANUR
MEPTGGKCQFQCPVSFEPVAEYNGRDVEEPDTEMWLIKAPADFTPESFNSHRLPLSGYKMLKVKVGGIRKFYHVTTSPCTDSPCRAFLPQDEGGALQLACTPPFQGVITLADAHAESTDLHPIPDRPPLTIPENLKKRYRPLGQTSHRRGKRRGQRHRVHPAKKRERQKNANIRT